MQSLCLTTARFGSKSSLSPLAVQLSSNRRFLHHHHGSDHTSVVASPVESSCLSNPLRFPFSFQSNPLRISAQPCQGFGLMMDKKKRGSRGVCHASLTFHPRTLQWISVISTAILMLTKGTAINKSYLVPLFALQAPSSVISWIRGDYGTWSAFLALLVRLFFFIPGELELPFITLLLVIVAPYQAMNLKGTQPGNILSLALAGYLAFQHFSREGSLKKAFSQGGLIASSAIILVTTVVALLLFI